jgi:hypothetical protein
MLFVVAGYPASGKSTALGLAASEGIALFPPRYDRDFKACLPGEVLEELTPTVEKLQRRMSDPCRRPYACRDRTATTAPCLSHGSVADLAGRYPASIDQ